ncbi:hypothetical protein BD413DRAFT_93846 [Trametes elegans]|nr:hypothetical protein BD413DRAFT_93846 [Trametes elegans]
MASQAINTCFVLHATVETLWPTYAGTVNDMPYAVRPMLAYTFTLLELFRPTRHTLLLPFPSSAPDMFSTKFIATLATLATLAASAVASGVEMRGDIGIITRPAADAVWKVGTQETVAWKLAFDPAPDAADGKLFLNYVGEGPSGDHHTGNKPIAENINLKSGSLDVSVPNIQPGEQYTLTLFTGDQAVTKPSSPFTIKQQ